MPSQESQCVQIVRYKLRPGMTDVWREMNSLGGAWAELYGLAGEGYLGTEFYVDPSDPLRCVTIDYWRTRGDWNRFKARYEVQFDKLTAKSRQLFDGLEESLADVDYTPNK